MKKSIENKIEKALGKKAGNELTKEVQKEVEKEISKEVKKVEGDIKKEVQKEVEKKLHIRLYEKTKSSALKFKEEFKKHIVTAITATFAFLIALSWRTPIQNSVNSLIEFLGLAGSAVYLEYLSAVIITFIAVLCLIWVSKWTAEKN